MPRCRIIGPNQASLVSIPPISLRVCPCGTISKVHTRAHCRTNSLDDSLQAVDTIPPLAGLSWRGGPAGLQPDLCLPAQPELPRANKMIEKIICRRTEYYYQHQAKHGAPSGPYRQPELEHTCRSTSHTAIHIMAQRTLHGPPAQGMLHQRKAVTPHRQHQIAKYSFWKAELRAPSKPTHYPRIHPAVLAHFSDN